MARSGEPADEGGHPRAGGRPRDSALDEAIILATRARLVRDGYSRMTIGDIVADAGVTRPTLYRRWKNKLELVVDALDYGFRKQADMYTVDLSQLDAREALVEAVHRLDPTYYNPDAMVLMANFAGEAIRTPELLDVLRRHAIEPRVALIERVLGQLRARGAIKAGTDVHTIASLCFGAYFGAFYRGEDGKQIPERVVAVLWPSIATQTSELPGCHGKPRALLRPGDYEHGHF
ncbi:MAG TPA: TetR/AcrR family transcriptional regulator [Trebonia sp.]|nr:TetR/AcrR family transcriptional regulator [Trebonia sp.]